MLVELMLSNGKRLTYETDETSIEVFTQRAKAAQSQSRFLDVESENGRVFVNPQQIVTIAETTIREPRSG